MGALPALENLRYLLPKGAPEWNEKRCALDVATRDTLLLYIRLLGPNVPSENDPLKLPRLASLGRLLSSIPIGVLLRSGWPLLAMLASFRWMTWRSHRLYPGAQVNLDDLHRALQVGAQQLALTTSTAGLPVGTEGQVENLRSQPSVRREVWRLVAESGEPGTGWRGPPLGAVPRRVARWLLEAPEDVPAVVYLTMFWGDMGTSKWVSRFLQRAMVVGLPRFAFMSPHRSWLDDCESVSAQYREIDGYRRLLCVRSFAPFARPYDVNNYAKFVLLPLFVSLGVDYAWLDVDIFMIRDPTARLLELAYTSHPNPDVLTTDHFDETCLNHGVIYVKASDRTLLWSLRYIDWMHVYPFGHDQNGWDAFLCESIRDEPLVPTQANVTLKVLDTGLEFLTLTGWGGTDADLPNALLLHMTRTTPIGMKEKRETLMSLLDVAASAPAYTSGGQRPEDAAVRELLRPLSKPTPAVKRPCYEGVHVAVERMVHDGSYLELFK